MGKATLLTHLKACAEAAKSFSTTVIAGVTQAVTELWKRWRPQKRTSRNPSLSPSSYGWVEDDTAGYPNYVDIPVQGVTSADWVAVVIEVESQALAASCKMCRHLASRWMATSEFGRELSPRLRSRRCIG